MSPKPTQIHSAPSKPCEDSAHHQSGNLTPECTRWNQITYKLTTPRFEIIDSVIIISLAKCLLYFVID